MFYEVNISKFNKKTVPNSYRHYFATAPRSITNKLDLKIILEDFVVKFPEPEFNITVTKDEQVQKSVDIKEILNLKIY